MADITKINLKGTELNIRDAGAARSSDLAAKQDALVSGTNIKTVNNESLLGSGNISVQGLKGDKGDKGDTVVLDPEGLEQFDVINDLTTGGASNALSAEMGLRLKSNINAVQANINKLYNKLANMAFWDSTDQEDAEPTALNWEVPQVTVSITNSIGGSAVIKVDGYTLSESSITIDKGSSLALTIEPAEGYILSSAAASVDGSPATLVESGGVYSLNIAQVNANMAIVVTGTATQRWLTAPKDDVSSGGSVQTYGMQQGRSIMANYGYCVLGQGTGNVPLVILSPAALPTETKVFDFAASGTTYNTNPGKTTAFFYATGGKRYLNVKLVDDGTRTGYVYKVAVGCYTTSVIGNNAADNNLKNVLIPGNVGRINYATPDSTDSSGTMFWKIDLKAFETAQNKGTIAYIKLLLCKYQSDGTTGVDSRTWYSDLTLEYKFTDD